MCQIPRVAPALGGSGGRPPAPPPALSSSPRRCTATGAGRRKPVRLARTAAAGPPFLLLLAWRARPCGVGRSRRALDGSGTGRPTSGVSTNGSGGCGCGSAPAAALASGLRFIGSAWLRLFNLRRTPHGRLTDLATTATGARAGVVGLRQTRRSAALRVRWSQARLYRLFPRRG